MASTDSGTIFLDGQLRLQRFTPSAQRIFNLLPADLGRKLSDLTDKVAFDGFLADAEKVLRDSEKIEREVRMGEQSWFLVRIAPYRTAEDRTPGVVATFIDITLRKRADAELRESEARYRAMFEQANFGIVQVGQDGRLLAVNPGACALTGYTEEELLKMNVAEVTHPDDLPQELEATRHLIAGEISEYTLEKRYVRKDGSILWGRMTGTLVRSALGMPAYILCIVQAIGDRKLAEEQLRISEERFRQFAENSADVFWILDAKTLAVEYVNPVYEKMWGDSRERLFGDKNRWLELVHPDDREEAVAGMPKVQAGETFVRNYRIVRPSDGQIRWIRDSGFPMRNDQGEIYRMARVAQDVTEDKERSEELRESEEKLRLLIEGARDYAMFLMDPSNHIIYWSKGAERVFGWSADEALGQTGELIFTPEDRAVELEEKEMVIARRDGAAPDRRWHLRKDGSRIWIDGIMRRLDDEKGELRGYAKIARDATEMRNAQDQLQHAHDELEERVRERTSELQAMNDTLEREMERRQMLEREILQVTDRERARISQDLHDSLCQELTATAFLLKSRSKEFLRDNPAAAEALEEAASTVNDNAGRARDLARGLHPFELAGGLPTALRELCARIQEKISCHCDAPRSLRLEENIAINLYRIAQEATANAIKHGKPTEIRLRLALESDAVVLAVEDNGKSKKAKMEPGMGIHIMQYRANAIGGSFVIEPSRGRGTKVICRVPLKN